MRRRRLDNVDYEADRLLVSGLTGIHPGQIAGWALVTIEAGGDGHFRSTSCCAFHGLQSAQQVCASYRDRFTPCSGDTP